MELSFRLLLPMALAAACAATVPASTPKQAAPPPSASEAPAAQPIPNTTPVESEAAFSAAERELDELDRRRDPRDAEQLMAFLGRNPHVYLRTRAALGLAALGDARAVPALAERLRIDPLQAYSEERAWEAPLRRSDNERVQAARLLANLALMYPEQRPSLLAASEDALLSWLDSSPSPHANGMRALAALGSTKVIPLLRAWADPKLPLPRVGDQPPMRLEWIVAQMAMRYEGMLKDPSAWGLFERSLKLRPAQVDVTLDGLMQGGMATLGMTLRAVGIGAAQGFSEWGDRRAVAPLLAYVVDPLNNEQARLEACSAVGWVADKGDLPAIVAAIGPLTPSSAAVHFRLSCLLKALGVRPHVFAGRDLLPLLALTRSFQAPVRSNHLAARDPRAQVALALAKGGLDPATEKALLGMLGDPELKTAATLALLLGGKADNATLAVKRYAGTPGWQEVLAPLWYESLDFFSREDVALGILDRYVENARVLAKLTLDGTLQTWARGLLRRRLAELEFDAGPHSLTRVRLRHALNAAARSSEPRQRETAMYALGLLGEQGTLAALVALPPPWGPLARTVAAETSRAEPPTTALVPEEYE